MNHSQITRFKRKESTKERKKNN